MMMTTMMTSHLTNVLLRKPRRRVDLLADAQVPPRHNYGFHLDDSMVGRFVCPDFVPSTPIIFSRTFLYLFAAASHEKVPTAVYGGKSRSNTGKQAAGLRSLLPARVCKELVQR